MPRTIISLDHGVKYLLGHVVRVEAMDKKSSRGGHLRNFSLNGLFSPSASSHCLGTEEI